MRAVVLLVAVGIVIAGAITIGARSSTPATPNPLFIQAKAEISALERAEGSYYAMRRRYTARLADLIPLRGGTDVGLQSPGLDIHADVSSDGETILLRVNSPAIGLGRVLRAGQDVGQMCQVLGPGAKCGPG